MANTVRHLKTIRHPKDDITPVYIMKVTVLDTINTDITIATPGNDVLNIDGVTNVQIGAINQTWSINKIMVSGTNNGVITVKNNATTLHKFPSSNSIYGSEGQEEFEVLEGLNAGDSLIIQSSVVDMDIILYVGMNTPFPYKNKL